jgi:hypothetical protein
MARPRKSGKRVIREMIERLKPESFGEYASIEFAARRDK